MSTATLLNAPEDDEPPVPEAARDREVDRIVCPTPTSDLTLDAIFRGPLGLASLGARLPARPPSTEEEEAEAN